MNPIKIRAIAVLAGLLVIVVQITGMAWSARTGAAAGVNGDQICQIESAPVRKSIG